LDCASPLALLAPRRDESGGRLPQSKTRSRRQKRLSVQGPNARFANRGSFPQASLEQQTSLSYHGGSFMSEAAPVKLTHNEDIKAAIPTLAGSIAATLADAGADHFSQDDYEFLKFHGCYQQDDRDLRKTAKHYIMMVRSRVPGGVMTASQWKTFDELSAKYGNNTLRLTTRQTIQFHGILKNNLRSVIRGINECLLSTLAACGDVSRNVLAPPTPAYTRARELVFADCRKTALALAPKTPAYHAIWIDGVQLNLEDEANKNFADPLYGKNYLPRKFKVAFAIPPANDIDIFANDAGFIAIVENDRLAGYNLCVGGGMGRSHGNNATYPRLADVLGFLTPERVVDAANAVLTMSSAPGSSSNPRGPSDSRPPRICSAGARPLTGKFSSRCSSKRAA
jgi:sulfite reductase (NADPH) hemoprotein beta-component